MRVCRLCRARRAVVFLVLPLSFERSQRMCGRCERPHYHTNSTPNKLMLTDNNIPLLLARPYITARHAGLPPRVPYTRR